VKIKPIKESIRANSEKKLSKPQIQFFFGHIQAGFPSPAEDYGSDSLNLHSYLVKHPASTFFVRVTGKSMIDAGIFEGDMLVVDKSKTPKNGDIIIAFIDGEFTVKKLRLEKNLVILEACNPDYDNIVVNSEAEFMIWGVVTSAIHRFD
jgi:DNA polymerase V